MLPFLLFLLFLIPLSSSPIGNPSFPSLLQEGFFISDTCWSNPQTGFVGDVMIAKRLRPCRASESIHLHKGALWGASAVGTASWSIRDRFNFQVELGSGQFEWRWQQTGRALAGFSTGGLMWSGDAKLVILEVKDTLIAVDARAGGWDWMEGHAAANGVALPGRTHSLLRFWQVGAALTQRISLFSPYLGFAVNRTRFKVAGLITGTGWMHARHTIGPFGGCTISNGSRFLVNLEWRGWFEEGVAISSLIRF